jgi:YVTN family beta-propeller protein
MRSPALIAVAGAVAAVLSASGQSAVPSTSLLVLSKGDLTLSIVDPSSLNVLGRVPSGPDPHEVIASADGKTAYISNYGGGSFNTITVVDLVAQKALAPIELGALRGPHGLVFVGGKLWFTAEGSKAIGRYDPASKQIDLVLGTGQNRTHMIYVFPDLNRIVTSNVSSASMTIIDRVAGRGAGPGATPAGGAGRGPGAGAEINWDETVVPVGRGAEGFDVSPDGKEIWAANAQDGTISVIDVASKKVSDTLQANVGGANRLKLTPDGRLVLVSSLRLPDLAVFDAASRKETRRIPIGRGAAGLEVQPDGARAYVACTPDDYVSVIDLKSMSVVGKIDAGKQPDGLAWAVRR